MGIPNIKVFIITEVIISYVIKEQPHGQVL